MKYIFSLLVILLIFPILINRLSSVLEEESTIREASTSPVVLANEMQQLSLFSNTVAPKVLIYFSHPQEAYKPVTLQQEGVSTTSHATTNIEALAPLIINQFQQFNIQVDQLQANVPVQLKSKGLPYKESYNVIRPVLSNQLVNNNYDLMIDIHRDAIKKTASTIKHQDLAFAKVAFIIGTKHKNYAKNYAYAQALHEQMNKLVPKISRGVITKGEHGSNGIYNQDLASNIILLELGAIENTEQEVRRTITVLGNAIANMLTNEQL